MIAGFIRQNLQGSIDRKLDSIDRKSCRFNFFAETSIQPKPIWCVGLSVYFKYNRKNPSYVLEVFEELCVESFVRFERCLPSYTHIELSRSRFASRT